MRYLFLAVFMAAYGAVSADVVTDLVADSKISYYSAVRDIDARIAGYEAAIADLKAQKDALQAKTQALDDIKTITVTVKDVEVDGGVYK